MTQSKRDGGDPTGSPDQSVWSALRVAAVVAAVALVGVAPFMHYLTAVAFPDAVQRRFPSVGTDQIIRQDLGSVALVIVLAALVGALRSERYGFAGLGDAARVRQARWLLLVVAPLVACASYLLFGRAIAERVPGYYPSSPAWGLARACKDAMFDEVVARYGMMTMLAGVVRYGWLANLLQAAFFTTIAYLGLAFYGVSPSLSAPFAASLVASFAISLGLGAIYARYGLIAAMLFHFVLGLRFVVHALMA